ncbi:hypothetical protein [Actinokineospora sp.]|uniref:hypothetical protein n=1 Tax=Actinokineospora sp. TaxID=1872133 RepID=UPI00403787B6
MSTGAIIGVIVGVAIVVVVLAVLAKAQLRRKHLREQFGSEYDRTVREQPRRAAERELADREKQHSQLDIKPLSTTTRERYTQQWALVQEQFVDRPGPAVEEADRLVTVLMGERGYPTDGDYEQRVAVLSVEHASTLDHYRAAHDIRSRHGQSQVSTEELREAMVRYRALFEDLLGHPQAHNGTANRGTEHRGTEHRGADHRNADHRSADQNGPAADHTPR